MQGHAVHHCRHAELAHAVVDVTAQLALGIAHHVAGRIHAQAGCALGVGEVGAGQVGRAAQQLGQVGSEVLQRNLAGLAAGHGLGLVVSVAHGLHGDLGKVGRQFALHAARELLGLGGEGCGVGGKAHVPIGLGRRARVGGVPGGLDVRGDHEGLGSPAQGFAGQLDLVAAQRLAVRLGGAGAVGRALADGRLADDEGGFVGTLLGLLDGGGHSLHVVAIDRAHHVPAVGGETASGVVHEPGRHRAVDADAVVVVQRDELVQLPGTGQGGGLVADAFHQAAVAQEGVGAVVNDRVAVAVELGGQQLLGQRHAHGIGDALAQRAGGGLHARGHVDLGVAGGQAVQLAEALQLGHAELVAGEVQQRVDQHRAVAVAEHETVAVGPVRVGRVVLEVTVPQRLGHVGHAHGGAGVARVGLLHGVHRQGADGVGHLGVFGAGGGIGHAASRSVGEAHDFSGAQTGERAVGG